MVGMPSILYIRTAVAYFGSHRRVYAASVISVAFIFGAYLLAKHSSPIPVAEASPEAALLQAIATKDSNGDGLPDWQKSLYGIPLNSTTTDYFHLGMTDGEAVARGLIVPRAIADTPATSSPATASAVSTTIDYAAVGLTAPTEGTLTDAFAKNFFLLYLAAKQQNGAAGLSVTDTQNIANQALNALAISVAYAPDFKSASDLAISGTGPDALRAFAIIAEAVLRKNASDATESDLAYLQDAVERDDATARAHLASLAKAYRNTAAGIAALPVPRELATADLAIVNSLMRLGEIYDDFSRVDTDPLAAMLSFRQYPQTELNAEYAFTTLSGIYAAAEVTLANGTPGAAFVNLIENLGAEQAAASGAATP